MPVYDWIPNTKERIRVPEGRPNIGRKLISGNRIGMILTILVVSAILAGIIRFYPEKKATDDSPKIVDPPPRPQPKPSDSDKEFTNSIGMKFVKIPAGWFMMGSPKDDTGRYMTKISTS